MQKCTKLCVVHKCVKHSSIIECSSDAVVHALTDVVVHAPTDAVAHALINAVAHALTNAVVDAPTASSEHSPLHFLPINTKSIQVQFVRVCEKFSCV